LCFLFTTLQNQSNAKIGHPGARGYEPENTLIVSKKQLTYRWIIELDVHLSADGELMVI
jgi:glycerophosphoryl diester phosphodiesterase